MKLFKVEHPKLPVRYFASKRAAKHRRDVYIEEGYTGAKVARGPDHRKGETV